MDLQSNELMIISAGPGSGKSTLIRYLLASPGGMDHDYAVLYSPSSDDYGYVDRSDRAIHYHTWTTAGFAGLLLKQKKAVDEAKSVGQTPPRLLLILDDCLGAVGFGTPICSHFFSVYRHYAATVVLTTQSINKVPELVRACATRAVLFRTHTYNNQRAAYESYLSHAWPSLTAWRDFNKTLPPHAFVVVDRRTGVVSGPMKCPWPINAPDWVW